MGAEQAQEAWKRREFVQAEKSEEEGGAQIQTDAATSATDCNRAAEGPNKGGISDAPELVSVTSENNCKRIGKTALAPLTPEYIYMYLNRECYLYGFLRGCNKELCFRGYPHKP